MCNWQSGTHRVPTSSYQYAGNQAAANGQARAHVEAGGATPPHPHTPPVVAWVRKGINSTTRRAGEVTPAQSRRGPKCENHAQHTGDCAGTGTGCEARCSCVAASAVNAWVLWGAGSRSPGLSRPPTGDASDPSVVRVCPHGVFGCPGPPVTLADNVSRHGMVQGILWRGVTCGHKTYDAVHVMEQCPSCIPQVKRRYTTSLYI